MTADTEVRTQMSEVPRAEIEIAIEDKCVLGMSSYQDLPKDCNGIDHVDDINGRDDPDGFYVIVSGTNDVTGDPIIEDLNADHSNLVLDSPNKDVKVQVGELNVENGEIVQSSADENNCTVDETSVVPSNDDVVLEGSIGNSDGGVEVSTSDMAEEQNGTAIVELEPQQLDCEVKLENPIALDSTPNTKEIQKSHLAEIEPAADLGENPESLIMSLEVGDSRDVLVNRESIIMSSEAGDSHDVSVNSEGQNNLESTVELRQSRKSQTVVLEVAGLEPSEVEFVEVKAEEQTKLELASEIEESAGSQITKSVEPGSYQLDNGEEKNSTDLDIDESAREVAESLDSQIIITKPVESGSFQLDTGEEKFEDKNSADLDIDGEEKQDFKMVVIDNVQSGLIQGHGAANLANGIDAPLGIKTARATVSDENEVSESKELSECIGGSSKKCLERNGNPENSQSFPYLTSYVMSESELGGSFSVGPNDGKIVEQKIGYGASLTTEGFPNCVADDTIPDTEVENLDVKNIVSVLSCPADDVKSEIEVKDGPVGGDGTSSCPAKYVSSETEIWFGSIPPEEKVPPIRCDVHIVSEISNLVHSISVNDLVPEDNVYNSLQNGSCADEKSESEVKNSSAISRRDMPGNDDTVRRPEFLDGPVVSSALNCVPEIVEVENGMDQVSGGDGGTDGKLKCQEIEDTVGYHRDGIPTTLPGTGSAVNSESALNSVSEIVEVENGMDQVNGGDGGTGGKLKCQEIDDSVEIHGDGIPASLPEGSGADAMEVQNVGAESVTRPFHFLIRIPRFDDETLREQIRHAQLQVDEKTQRRDAIRVEIQIKRANCQAHGDRYEAAKSAERAARRLVKLKRQEIDSVQSVINRVKNAISVKAIDVRIQEMEHRIVHETLSLKEEKQFIREIKQLKHLREHLSSNMGSQDEVQQALDQRDQTEERLKILKKELDCLKDRVSKSETAAVAAGKKYDDESQMLKELQGQFRAADGIRQEAYTHLLSLRRQLYEKNKHFRMYKDDATASSDYAAGRDRGGLHHLCVNQVETIMELWKKNDEFRKEYVRCNMRSTLWRLRTFDGRSLGPDEEPPVLPSYVDERVDRLVSSPGKVNSVSLVSMLEQGKQASVEVGEADGQSVELVAEQKNQKVRSKKTAKPILGSPSATVSGRNESEEIKEDENMQTKKEQEFARKAEELRKEEVAAKLKEQRCLEEKAKAEEAHERKKRNAEKAQIRAELRALKEAEQKEKEREKRLRKKERKKAAVVEAHDDKNDGETAPTSEIPTETSKESESNENPSMITKRPPKPSHFTKQNKPKYIPPPPRNRGKRRMQQWAWLILAALLVLALFLLGNSGFFVSLRLRSVRF